MFHIVTDKDEEIVRRLDGQLGSYLQQLQKESETGESEPLGLGTVVFMLPLFCHADSSYYRAPKLLEYMNEAMANYLATQLPSGCISLVNCNIDSPPDTAFAAPIVAQLYQVAERSGLSEIKPVQEALRTFLERARPCLLTGGIHTSNHRWVMAGALAKMYELFGDEAFRERAFQFLDEGFDMTEYGEWTERSNAIYNGACALHLYDVGRIFGYESAFEAIRRNLSMMQYMLHPGDAIVTEYSGRQDNGQTMFMNEWYYVVYRLMATRDRNPLFASMAAIAERTAPRGTAALMYWMLQQEDMNIRDEAGPLSEHYTVLLGEDNEVPVPQTVPYRGKLPGHPHGASVLRHRRGNLSVTAMAGQQELLYIQFGRAKMFGLKLAAGWFGVAGVIFPGIKRVGDNTYRMQIELEGCYFNPLPKHLTEGTNGMYVKMPNQQREKTHVNFLPLTVDFTLHDDGVDVRVVSDRIPNIYLQAICMFEASGTVEGEDIRQESPYIRQLTNGDAVYSVDGDCISVSEGAREHKDVSMRNDKVNRDAINVTVNWKTPTNRMLRFRCFTRSS